MFSFKLARLFRLVHTLTITVAESDEAQLFESTVFSKSKIVSTTLELTVYGLLVLPSCQR